MLPPYRAPQMRRYALSHLRKLDRAWLSIRPRNSFSDTSSPRFARPVTSLRIRSPSPGADASCEAATGNFFNAGTPDSNVNRRSGVKRPVALSFKSCRPIWSGAGPTGLEVPNARPNSDRCVIFRRWEGARRFSSCARIPQPPENPQSRRPRMRRAPAQLFRRGEIWGPSISAVTQEGECASAPDRKGGSPPPSRPLAPAFDTSTAQAGHARAGHTRGDTTWPPPRRDRRASL